MKRLKTGIFLTLVFILALGTIVLIPCDGTINPPCGRTIYLAKFSPQSVVLPASGPISVPIGLLPFVSWDNVNTNVCAQPTSATLTLTLICTPIGGGSASTIGPVNIPVPIPTTPGAQTNIGSPVSVTIPAGTITNPSTCLVQGTYSVTFSNGIGDGTISGTGDVEVCLVEPSPLDESFPRLDMQFIDPIPGGMGFQTCRAGDQAVSFFQIVNNDPEHSVTFSFSSSTRQTAGLPDGVTAEEAPGMNLFSISSPIPGTDAFNQFFTDENPPGTLIPPGHPTEVNDQLIMRDQTLGPLEATVIPVSIRSYGACGDGSCSEQTAKLTGSYSNGDVAFACASTLLLVDDVLGKTPLCEFNDHFQVQNRSDAIWGPAHFRDAVGESHHVSTHTQGNTDNVFGNDAFFPEGRATRTGGADIAIPGDGPWPTMGDDIIRGTPDSFFDVQYNVLIYSEANQFSTLINRVQISGLNNSGKPHFDMPAVFDPNSQDNPQVLDIDLNAGTDQIEIESGGQSLFSGNVNDFLNNPPDPFIVEQETMRRFSKVDPGTAIYSDPPVLLYHSSSIRSPGTTSATIKITDQNGLEAPWSATIRGAGVSLRSPSATGDLTVDFDPDALPEAPETNLAFIDVNNLEAINSPLVIPVVLRTKDEVPSSVGDFVDNAIPRKSQLHHNFPNPFNPTTKIQYDLSQESFVKLIIFNQRGQVVRTLVDRQMNAGSHFIEWDGRNSVGDLVASGIYLAVMRTKDFTQSRKITFLR